MAKPKRRKKSKSTSRRRVGAMALNAQSPMVQIGAAAIGFIFGDKINAAIDNVTGTMDAKLVGAGEAGIGAALMFMKLGKKKTILEVGAGGVLAGAGAKRLLKAFGIINGFEAVPVIGRRMLQNSSVNGYGAVPVVAGYNVPQRMNGVFNGYNVPPLKQTVMGNVGSGVGMDGSELMN